MRKDKKATPQNAVPQRAFILYSSHMDNPKEFMGKTHGHFHADCWQLEIIVSGQLRLNTREKTYEMNSGKMAIIPPGLWHAFVYDGKNVECWSVKFALEGFRSKAGAKVIKGAPLLNFFKEQILRFLPDAMDKTRAIALEYLLADLIDIQYCRKDFLEETPPLHKEICAMLSGSTGMNMHVKDIAEKLGYSKDYLNRFFKKHTGATLKNYIDIERFTLAKKHLAYSNKSISEIAAIMGFPDVFAFSRFFTRMNGDSPRCFRNYLAKQSQDKAG